MRLALTLLLATGCGFSGKSTAGHDGGVIPDATDGPMVDAGPDDGGLGPARKKTITIDRTKVTGKLDDFPVWIDITDDDLANHAALDGSDIYFTKPDGSLLAYELAHWDRPAKRLQAWVRSRVVDDAPTDIVLHYGDLTMQHPPQPVTVFSAGFVAVWHLEDTLANTTVAETLGAHAGTARNLSGANHVTGKLGWAVAFDGGTGQIEFANPLTGATDHTISLWVAQQTTNDNDALVVLGTGACGQARWLHGRYDAATMAVGFYCNDWANPGVNLIGAGPTLIHWVFSNNQSRIYRNGALVAGPFTQTGTAISTAGTDGFLGNAPGAFGQNMGAHATLDEVRIARVARGADWVATEYANQASPGTFYTVGPEQ